MSSWLGLFVSEWDLRYSQRENPDVVFYDSTNQMHG